jgi:hypothetical protein
MVEPDVAWRATCVCGWLAFSGIRERVRALAAEHAQEARRNVDHVITVVAVTE